MGAPSQDDYDYALDELDRVLEFLVLFIPVVQQYLDSFVRDGNTTEEELRYIALLRNAVTAAESGEKMEPLPE